MPPEVRPDSATLYFLPGFFKEKEALRPDELRVGLRRLPFLSLYHFFVRLEFSLLSPHLRFHVGFIFRLFGSSLLPFSLPRLCLF